jgi:adhesin transport system outer membrane protein
MKTLPSLPRISLAVAAAVLAQSPVFAQTLKDAVDQTVQTNPDVRQEANQRLANDEAVKGARGGFFPKVDVGGGYGREWSKNATTRALSVAGTSATNQYFGNDGYTLTRREANATLSQMLFDGFGVSSEVDRNKSRVESAAYKTAGTAEYTGLRAVEAYLNVLRNRDLVRLTKANLEYHLKVQDQITVRSGGGVGRRSDQEQVDARVALSRANLVSAEPTRPSVRPGGGRTAEDGR